MAEDRALYPPQKPIATGLRGRCPRCGEGRLFDGFLTLAPRCSRLRARLRLRRFGRRAGGLRHPDRRLRRSPARRCSSEIAYSPPIWVHVVLWGPLVLILCLGLLRPLKGVLVALQYHHRAEQGRIDRAD